VTLFVVAVDILVDLGDVDPDVMIQGLTVKRLMMMMMMMMILMVVNMADSQPRNAC
jgi:hypothetical protein